MNPTPADLLDLLGRHVELGHAQRDACFLRQVRLALSGAGAPLPQAASHSASTLAQLASFYRFTRNEDISLPDVRRIRAEAVLDLVAPGADVLIVHDVSQLDYSTHNSKEDRRLIGDHGGKGYEYVSCAAIDPRAGSFLGILHDTLVNADGPDDRDVMDYGYEPLFARFSHSERKRLRENHRHQMAVHIRGLTPLLAGRNAVHAGDREFDDLFLFYGTEEVHANYVIRTQGNRNVQVPQYEWLPNEALTPKQAGHACPDGWACANLRRLVDAVPLRPYKSLPLDAKGRVAYGSAVARVAHLSIGACRVRLYRQAKRNQRYFRLPRAIELTLVVIRETQPPVGVSPLCWTLFTNLPVDTPEELAWVGHLYELRWAIEEFHRLLKSGYDIEAEPLDNAEKIAKSLVLQTLAAMAMVNLKREVGLPPEGRLSEEDYRRVKTAVRELNNPRIPLALRLFALVVQLGGWLGRRRDPIGPTVLMRGLLQVLTMLDALPRYGPLLDEARANPDIVRRLFCV